MDLVSFHRAFCIPCFPAGWVLPGANLRGKFNSLINLLFPLGCCCKLDSLTSLLDYPASSAAPRSGILGYVASEQSWASFPTPDWAKTMTQQVQAVWSGAFQLAPSCPPSIQSANESCLHPLSFHPCIPTHFTCLRMTLGPLLTGQLQISCSCHPICTLDLNPVSLWTADLVSMISCTFNLGPVCSAACSVLDQTQWLEYAPHSVQLSAKSTDDPTCEVTGWFSIITMQHCMHVNLGLVPRNIPVQPLSIVSLQKAGAEGLFIMFSLPLFLPELSYMLAFLLCRIIISEKVNMQLRPINAIS